MGAGVPEPQPSPESTQPSTLGTFLRGAGWAVLAAALVLMVWLAVTGWSGFSAARAAQQDAAAIDAAARDGDSAAIVTALGDLRGHAATASDRFNSAPWAWLHGAPVVGSSVQVAAALTGGVDAAARVTDGQDGTIRGTLAALGAGGDGGLAALGGLDDLAPLADRMAAAVQPHLARVLAVPQSDLIGPAAFLDARAEFVDGASNLPAAAAAMRSLPTLLGNDGPREWLVIVQNSAEARGTGGLVSAYARLRVADGRFTPQVADTTNAFANSQHIPLRGIPSETRALWGDNLSRWWGLNMDRHFPFAGLLASRAMSSISGAVDDVISIDAHAVAALLSVTGPIEAAGVTVSSDTAVDFFTKDIYQRFPNQERKDAVTVELTGALLSRFGSGLPDLLQLLDALGDAAASGSILAYSTQEQLQRDLERMPISGVVPQAPGPLATLAVNDFAGSKMDAYLRTDIRFASAAACGQMPSRVRVAFTNDAPRDLPRYVDIRADGAKAPRGSTLFGAAIYAPVGSALVRATLDGEEVDLKSGSSRSHPVWLARIDIRRGQTRTFEVEFQEPIGTGAPPEFLEPILTNPASISVDSTC